MPSRRIRLNEHAFPCNEDVDALLSGVRLPEGFLDRMRSLARKNQAESLGRDNHSGEISTRLSSVRPNSGGRRPSGMSRQSRRRSASDKWISFPSLLDL